MERFLNVSALQGIVAIYRVHRCYSVLAEQWDCGFILSL